MCTHSIAVCMWFIVTGSHTPGLAATVYNAFGCISVLGFRLKSVEPRNHDVEAPIVTRSHTPGLAATVYNAFGCISLLGDRLDFVEPRKHDAAAPIVYNEVEF